MFSHTEFGLVLLLRTSVHPSFTVFLQESAPVPPKPEKASSSPASQPGKLLSAFTSLAALNSAVGQEGFEYSFELRSVFFSTVSDGQGKGSGVSKDLRLSKCLLSSLLVIPLGIPGFIRRRKRKHAPHLLCSSNPVAADCVCLVPCLLFYTHRQ